MVTLSNEGLISAVRSMVKEERRITRKILDHINEVERRRLYAELGFSSIFDWLVKDLGYSESAAYRRMQAARLLRAVPGAADKIESGELGLTVLSKVQTLIRNEEKRTGERMSFEKKSEVLTKVESCSAREADCQLAEHFPEAPTLKETTKGNVRVMSHDQVSVQLIFTREQFQKLQRIAEVLSHTHIDASNAELLEAAMDVFLDKNDPLKKATKPKSTRSDTAAEVKSSTRNSVFTKAGGQCEYREPKTHRRCESRHFLEIDHIQPRALGGTNSLANLRALCRTHNLLMAERIFGRKKIEPFRRLY